jgi:hypothetical protein
MMIESETSRDLSVLDENLGQRLMGYSGCNNDDDSLTYVSPSLKISTDPKLVAHGRGLVVVAPIQAGELLFVHPPTVKADVSQVLRIYKNKAGSRNDSENNNKDSSSSSLLESIAETVLLKEMKRAVRGRKKESSARTAASFLALNSDHSTRNNQAEANTGNTSEPEEERDRRFLHVLLGKGEAGDAERILTECGAAIDDNDYLLGIIRHNAFGPDFHHYHRMERELLHSNTSAAGSAFYYSRMLGHYPLAAMINHSCGPTNATRVFYNETMVATATQAIPTGKEILWPYCPPISPFPDRNQQLKKCYGFSCRSNRCVLEERAYGIGIPPPKIPMGLGGFAGGSADIDVQLDLQQWEKLLKSLEVWYKVVATKIVVPTPSNNGKTQNAEDRQQHQLLLLQHGLRLGYTHIYIRYFNEALQQQRPQPESVRANILREANELHSAFLTVHNGCTEHLSLLHLCYELSATTTPSGIDSENEKRNAIQFWTEELKKAHLCRYSNDVVGRDLATLRKVLKHTRTVLRTRDGWKNSGNQNGVNSFI